jgi:hypothetical protein
MNDNPNATCGAARRTGLVPIVALALVLGIVATTALLCFASGTHGRPRPYREPGWVLRVLEKVMH